MDGYEKYDIQEEDPYLIPDSTCLRNLLRITDTQKLNEAEAAISSAAIAELIAGPVEPTFDLVHLCNIHQHLFRDVYDWAGQPRKTEIAKGDRLFLPYQKIEEVSSQIFDALHRDNLLSGLELTPIAHKAAYYLGRINMVHPFREGNGRVQRVLLDQLVEMSGFAFQWSAVSGWRMAEACRDARQVEPDYRRLERLLAMCITRL